MGAPTPDAPCCGPITLDYPALKAHPFFEGVDWPSLTTPAVLSSPAPFLPTLPVLPTPLPLASALSLYGDDLVEEGEPPPPEWGGVVLGSPVAQVLQPPVLPTASSIRKTTSRRSGSPLPHVRTLLGGEGTDGHPTPSTPALGSFIRESFFPAPDGGATPIRWSSAVGSLRIGISSPPTPLMLSSQALQGGGSGSSSRSATHQDPATFTLDSPVVSAGGSTPTMRSTLTEQEGVEAWWKALVDAAHGEYVVKVAQVRKRRAIHYFSFRERVLLLTAGLPTGPRLRYLHPVKRSVTDIDLDDPGLVVELHGQAGGGAAGSNRSSLLGGGGEEPPRDAGVMDVRTSPRSSCGGRSFHLMDPAGGATEWAAAIEAAAGVVRAAPRKAQA